jgi:hypothetical protein
LEQQYKTLQDLFHECIVRLDVADKIKGTGFFVAPGLILTCAHVVKDKTGQPATQPIKVHWRGKDYPAQIEKFRPPDYPDLALLRAEKLPTHPCVYLDSDVQLDDKLYSFGYPEGYPNGDPVYFDYEGLSPDPDFLKLKNAQASHGLSGAPLLDRRTGAVCGILKKTRDARTDLGGRAIPVSTIFSEVSELSSLQEKFHRSNKTWTVLLSRRRSSAGQEEDGKHILVTNGGKAVIHHDERVYNITVQPQSAAEAEEIVRQLRKEEGDRDYYGTPLRRLEPLVLINRAEDLRTVEHFLNGTSLNLLYVIGLPAVGKSTLVRGALELRRAGVPTVWVTGLGLDVERFLSEVNAGLHLGIESVLRDPGPTLEQKAAILFGAIREPCILVLDGFEALLDSDDRYRAEEMAALMESLSTLEHEAKVLVTTRRLPQGVGEGSAGIQILPLHGLSTPAARELLKIRSQLSLQEMEAVFPADTFERLHGHPKFIELLASAIDELPAEQVATHLLDATDIGGFVVETVLNRTSPQELKVLRAALVFRAAFPFEALSAVYGALNDDTATIIKPVRTLVRRAVLEKSADSHSIYFLHPILRDAVPHDASQAAAAHEAAAAWFLSDSIDFTDLTTWDDGLYHLRLAAEVGLSDAYFYPYYEFISANAFALQDAGWHQRALNECETLYALASDETLRFVLRWMRINLLHSWGDNAEVEPSLREHIAFLNSTISEAEQVGDTEHIAAAEDAMVVAKSKLGIILLEVSDSVDEVRQIADEIGLILDKGGDVQPKLRNSQLRFAIARKDEDAYEMLRWAIEAFDLALQWVEDLRNPQTIDALAEAHFSMGLAYLWLPAGQLNVEENQRHMFSHFVSQLQLKLEIGKISGVALGLFNLGTLTSKSDPVVGGAMLLTSQQIALEKGMATHRYAESGVEQYFEQHLRTQENIEHGRETLRSISEILPPYFDRALERGSGRLSQGGDRTTP